MAGLDGFSGAESFSDQRLMCVTTIEINRNGGHGSFSMKPKHLAWYVVAELIITPALADDTLVKWNELSREIVSVI